MSFYQRLTQGVQTVIFQEKVVLLNVWRYVCMCVGAFKAQHMYICMDVFVTHCMNVLAIYQQ